MAAMPANAQPGPAATPAFDPGATQTLRAEFIALTCNDELLEQLGQALDGDCAIRHCETMDAVAAQLSRGRAHVVMVDAREHADPGSAIERIQMLADSCVVVVFAATEQTSRVADDIRRSAVFAVLPIPVETGKTAAVLAGARDEALARLVIVAPPVPAAPRVPPPGAGVAAPQVSLPASARQPAYEPVSRTPESTAASIIEPAHRRPSPAIIFGATLLALLVLAALWLATRGPDEGATPTARPDAAPVPARSVPDTPPVALPEPAPVAAQEGSLDELLVKAQAAFRERRYTEPANDNALMYYRSVLAQRPESGEALEGLQRIRAVLDARFDAALAEHRLDDASTTLAQLERIDGDDPALAGQRTKLVELRITTAIDAGQLDRAALLLRDAMQASSLPPARAAGLRADLERRQAEAKAQRQAAETARRYAELRAFDPGSVPATPATRDAGAAASALPSVATPVAAMDPAGAGPTTGPRSSSAGGNDAAAPARPAAGAAAAPAAPQVRAADFKRTRYVEPVYPKDALEEGIRGDVRLRITVDTDGRVKHVEVLSSSPPGVFEESALTAVRRWRFKPIEVDGKAVEASATTTVVFQPAGESRR